MSKEYLKSITKKRKSAFLEAAVKLGVKLEVVSKEFRILKLSRDGFSCLMQDEQLYFNMRPSTIFSKNKEMTKIILRKKNLSVPEGIYSNTLADAIVALEENKITFPVVVKPIDAAKGLGVTVGIKTKKEIGKAVKKIENVIKKTPISTSGSFMIEKMVQGRDYRVLVFFNEVIACVERVPAYVIGDGKSTVKELIDSFNKNRPESFWLKIDKEVKAVLKKKSLDLGSVLLKKQRLQLRENANISSGGRSFDKTGVISDHFKKIALKAAKALGLNFAGIDILTGDISSEDAKQRYWIIEINGAPDYDIHEKPVVIGKGVDVTALLVRKYMHIK